MHHTFYLITVPQELTGSVKISLSRSNHTLSSKAYVLSRHNYPDIPYELQKNNKLCWNIAQDTLSSPSKEETQGFCRWKQKLVAPLPTI